MCYAPVWYYKRKSCLRTACPEAEDVQGKSVLGDITVREECSAQTRAARKDNYDFFCWFEQFANSIADHSDCVLAYSNVDGRRDDISNKLNDFFMKRGVLRVSWRRRLEIL